MSCGCTDPCQPNSIPCTCEARVTSDCVTVSGATSNCLAIDDNLLLTDYLTQMDERICEKVDSVTNFIALENVGTGSQLYKGDSLLGKKQIRTVKSIDPNLVVTQTENEIQLDLNLPATVPPDGTETKLVSGTNTTVAGNGSIATPYSVNVTFPTPPVYDGSETKVIAGTNTTVTGLGTTTSPYVVNSTDTIANGSETKINAGTNVTVTGNGTTATPYIINSTASGGGNQGIQDVIQTDPVINIEASILLSQGSSLSVKGETQGGYEERSPWLKLDSFATPVNPYDNNATVEIGISNEANDTLFKGFKINENGNIEIVAPYRNEGLVYSSSALYDKEIGENTVVPRWYLNQQKYLTALSTNLSLYDHDNVIFVGNGANDITITVDSSHGVSNFEVGFIQIGTGTVTFVAGSGITLLSPNGYKMKGQNYQAFLIRRGNTNTYHLLGNVVP